MTAFIKIRMSGTGRSPQEDGCPWRGNPSPFQQSPAASCLPFSGFALRAKGHIPLDPPICRGQISEDGQGTSRDRTHPKKESSYHRRLENASSAILFLEFSYCLQVLLQSIAEFVASVILGDKVKIILL